MVNCYTAGSGPAGGWPRSASPEPTSNHSPQGWRQIARPVASRSHQCLILSELFIFYKSSGYDVAFPWCSKFAFSWILMFITFTFVYLLLGYLFLKYWFLIAHFFIGLFAFLLMIHKISLNIQNTNFFLFCYVGWNFFFFHLDLVFFFLY